MQKYLVFYIAVALVVTVPILSGCAIGKRSVYLTDLPSKQILTIHHDTLIVKPQYTMNSAKCIYKINISVDNSQRKIYLSAVEALVRTNKPRSILELLLYPFTRPCKDIFHIKLCKYKVSEPNSFEYYWRDPDKKTTKLEIISYAQNENLNKTKLIRIFDGDTTSLFVREFEIDIRSKKVYFINPVMNYLDIKDGKPKYEIDVKREKWNKIIKSLSEINLLDYEIVTNENKGYGYSITYFFVDNTHKTHITQNEKALENLKEIIRLIRE